MEKFMRREKDIVEYDSPLQSVNRRSSEEMDFDDVFGGPPRRFSMPEIRVRYSFGNDQSEEEGESSSGKPVFGGESGAAARRRRQGGDDFYGDIFRGADYSSPRRSGNLIGSNSPGSRIMSPVSFRPKADPFGTSLPSHFSLPAKLTNAMEFPRNHSRNKMEESTSGLNSPGSSSSLSRFSNLGIQQGHDGTKNEVYPVHHQSPLPPEACEENDTRNLDGFGNQFHFSIYSWAGDGVPIPMPVGVGNNWKSKDISVNEKSDHIETEKRDLWKKEGPKKLENSFQEALYDTPESKSRSSSKEGVVFGRTKQTIKDEQVKSVDKKKKIEKAHLNVEESRDFEMKPSHAFLSDEDEDEQPENVKEMNENKTRSSKKAHESQNTKRNGGTASVDKSSLPGVAINSGMGSGISRVTGKVSDFVQIFNQEYDSRPKADIKTRSQSFRWKDIGVNQEKNENAAKVNEKVILKKDLSSRSFHFSANQQNASSSESTYKDLKISVENSDDPLEDNFLVQEIFDDHEEVKQGEASEDIKALDAKIQKWSVGKKGNIRSLLSTLQYVLWDGSGWKPVALVDLIEENSVKRAYQKALLRLHPDKLQQKDASVHHKYIAQKVFDILQEAWDGFNNLAPL